MTSSWSNLKLGYCYSCRRITEMKANMFDLRNDARVHCKMLIIAEKSQYAVHVNLTMYNSDESCHKLVVF